MTLFGIIAGHTILETARDALFLARLKPSRLALVYAIVATLSLLTLKHAMAIAQRYGRRSTLVVTLMVASYGTVLLYFQEPSAVAVFVLYLWSAFLGTILAAQYWLLAGQIFSIAQGKRLFGPIAAGGVLGAVAGASAAALLLTRVSVRSLLLAAAALFLATALFVAGSIRPDATQPARARAPARPPPGRPFAEGLKESPYVRRLLAITVLGSIAMLTLDYLFKASARNSMPPEALGPFFAKYYAILNAVALVVQLFVAGALVHRLGVVASAAVLPFLFVGGALASLLGGGGLALVALTRGADGSLRHSLHRVTNELLHMPIPADLRDQSKSALESFVPRLTQAAAATVIFVLGAMHVDSPRLLSAIVAISSLAWLASVVGLRSHYIDLFRQALSRASLDVGSRLPALDLHSFESVLEALSSRESARVIAAMHLLEDGRRVRLIPALVLYHESEEVVVEALRIFARGGRKDWFPIGEKLLAHHADPVRIEAIAALAKHGVDEGVRRLASDASPLVRGHAAFFLASADPAARPSDHPLVQGVLGATGKPGIDGRAALLDAIQNHGDSRWRDVLLELSRVDEPENAQPLSLAMKALPDPRFIPLLVERLQVRDGRTVVREALVAHGPLAQAALEKALLSEATPQRVRLHVPRTLALFANQRAADFLLDQLALEKQGDVRYKVLRGLGRVALAPGVKVDRVKTEAEMRKNLGEYLRVLSLKVPLALARAGQPPPEGSEELLLGLLDDKLAQALERAFRLMQVVFVRENIRGAYLALLSSDRRARESATEFLDALALSAPTANTPEVRELFRLVVDDLPDPERVTRATEAGYVADPPSTHLDALARLVADPDVSLAAIASYHALELGIASLEERVERAVQARPGLRAFAPADREPKSPDEAAAPALGMGPVHG